MTTGKASPQDVQAFLDQYPDWSLENAKLHREFLFKDFVQAFGFISSIALIAERDNHHPEWFNVYRKVVVDLTTHEVGGISDRDFKLALSMEQVSGTMSEGSQRAL